MVRRWLIGLIGGAVALALLSFFFPGAIVLLIAVALLKPRPVAAGGAFTTWGAAFLLEMRRAADGCAAFNRSPNAGCAMGDNTPYLMAGLAVLALGVVLTGYSIIRARSGLS